MQISNNAIIQCEKQKSNNPSSKNTFPADISPKSEAQEIDDTDVISGFAELYHDYKSLPFSEENQAQKAEYLINSDFLTIKKQEEEPHYKNFVFQIKSHEINNGSNFNLIKYTEGEKLGDWSQIDDSWAKNRTNANRIARRYYDFSKLSYEVYDNYTCIESERPELDGLDLTVIRDDLYRQARKKNKKFQDWGGLQSEGLSTSNIMFDCCEHLYFNSQFKLTKALLCKQKFCPVCARRKSLRHSYELKNIIKYMADNNLHNHKLVFATFTVRNTHFSQLESEIQKLNKAFSKFMRFKEVKKAFLGSYRALEITYQENDVTQAHPHLHVLFIVPPHYYDKQNKDYLSAERMGALWQKALGVSYTPNVDIRPLGAKDREQTLKKYWCNGELKSKKSKDIVKRLKSSFNLFNAEQLVKDQDIELQKDIFMASYTKSVKEVTKYLSNEVSQDDEPENEGVYYFYLLRLMFLHIHTKGKRTRAFTGLFKELNSSANDVKDDEELTSDDLIHVKSVAEDENDEPKEETEETEETLIIFKNTITGYSNHKLGQYAISNYYLERIEGSQGEHDISFAYDIERDDNLCNYPKFNHIRQVKKDTEKIIFEINIQDALELPEKLTNKLESDKEKLQSIEKTHNEIELKNRIMQQKPKKLAQELSPATIEELISEQLELINKERRNEYDKYLNKLFEIQYFSELLTPK